jgi:hypothetical protein
MQHIAAESILRIRRAPPVQTAVDNPIFVLTCGRDFTAFLGWPIQRGIIRATPLNPESGGLHCQADK